MQTQKRSIDQIINEQIQRWEYARREPKKETRIVVTVSREPGSGGGIVAKQVAESLHLDYFHQEVINEMARSAKVSDQLVKSLDEKGLNILEHSIAAVVQERHLWPDEYLKHLLKVIGTIAKHGNAVIVGRGASFILPQKDIFRVRIIAPREFRVQKVAETFDVPLEEARRRVLQTESDRRAFVRKSFHEEVTDPANYDLVLNTGSVSISEAAESICAVLRRRVKSG